MSSYRFDHQQAHSLDSFRPAHHLRHHSVLAALSLALVATLSGCFDPQVAEPTLANAGAGPNIIVILTDDQGWSDLGSQGVASDVQTPHIDQLAADGVRMTSGYSTAPQCTPSRAALVTGRYQQKFGVDDNKFNPMPLDEITLGERLQDAGYRTGMIGKWHLEVNSKSVVVDPDTLSPDELSGYFPDQRGFDDVYVGYRYSWRASFDFEGNEFAASRWLDNRFRIDVATDAALAFVDKNHQQPFFLYLSYYAPHLPLEAPDHYLSRFPESMDVRRRYALAMMAAVDDGVGKLRDRLQQYELTEDTLVFFISDNGAPLGIHKLDLPINRHTAEWDGSINEPWVGEKGMLTEGGIRVPFIASWPAALPAGVVYSQPVSTLDVASTSLAAAGVRVPDVLDGVDLLPHLAEDNNSSGDSSPDNNLYNNDNNTEHGELANRSLFWRFWSQAAVRKGRWKYLLAAEREYLFDLDAEHENQNLIGQYPDIAIELRTELSDWSATLHRPGLPESPLNNKEEEWFDHYLPAQVQ